MHRPRATHALVILELVGDFFDVGFGMRFPTRKSIVPIGTCSFLADAENEDAATRVEKGTGAFVDFAPFFITRRDGLNRQRACLELLKTACTDQFGQAVESGLNDLDVYHHCEC